VSPRYLFNIAPEDGERPLQAEKPLSNCKAKGLLSFIEGKGREEGHDMGIQSGPKIARIAILRVSMILVCCV